MAQPDERFIYSDINLILLGDIVSRISGMSLDQFARVYLFEPLGMRDTMFNPPAALRSRIAPTDRRKSITRLHPWQRAIIVLLDRFAPRLSTRLSRSDGLPDHVPSPLEGRTPDWPKGWRRAFIANAHHAEIGARWAQEEGCSSQSVSLIRRHQDRLENSLSPVNEQDQLLAEPQQLLAEPQQLLAEPQQLLAELQQLLAALQEADNLN